MANTARQRTLSIRDKTLRDLQRIYGNEWRELRKDIEPRIDEMLLHDDEATQAERLEHADKHGRDALIAAFVAAALLANRKANTRINTCLVDVYGVNADDVRGYIASATGVNLARRDVGVQSLLSGFTKKAYARRLSKTHVSRGIINEVERLLKDGKGTRVISKHLETMFSMNRTGAYRIAVTESTRIQTLGRLDAIREAERHGMVIKKIWRHQVHVKAPRDFHLSMDGQEANDDGEFESGLGNMSIGPGLFGLPEEDINCRCFLDERIESW